jgi:aspartyl-tRNA(Asn)/glutamyl-tRNA(Gln) amidotransferase subunit A
MTGVAGPSEEARTITALAPAIRERRLSVVALTQAVLERIGQRAGGLRAFVAVDAEGALRRAAALDAELRGGRLRGPLHGIPLGYKDCFFVAGLPNSCGTAARDYWTAAADCAVARRLDQAGAVTIGKLAMTELAMGTFGLNPGQGTPVNPRAPERIPGGSSSGSAVAVAAGLVPGALGTDTGGSIRLPAACCGVAGLKPTFGRVSRAGVMPLSPTLDHVGFVARTTADLGLLLAATAGPDAEDPATSPAPVPDLSDLAPAAGLTVGVPDRGFFRDVKPDVAAALAEAAHALSVAGVTVRLLALPDPGPMIEATGVIVRAEAAAEHEAARRDCRGDLSAFVQSRLDAGAATPAIRYIQAMAACRRLRRAFLAEVFATVDALLLPMTPEPPLTLEDAMAGPVERVMERMARFARFARLFNGLGVPALALPVPTASGPPLAVQLVARPFGEPVLLRLGAALEAAGGAPAAVCRERLG